MVKNLPPNDDSFSEYEYVSDIGSAKELLQKEIDVNHEEQVVLKSKIDEIKNLLTSMTERDPQAPVYKTQLEMSEIELDELVNQERELVEKLRKLEEKEKDEKKS